MNKQQKLKFIIYISRARDKIEKLNLVDLCAKAAVNNKTLDITGLLLCIGNSFIQVLEGSEETVNALYHKIAQDPRHTQCRILFEEATSHRLFNQWSMNFLQLDDAYFLQYEEIAELKKYIEKFLVSPGNRTQKIVKLIQQLPKILKAHRVELDILSPATLASGKS